MAICPYGGVVDGCLCLDTLCLEGGMKAAYPVSQYPFGGCLGAYFPSGAMAAGSD